MSSILYSAGAAVKSTYGTYLDFVSSYLDTSVISGTETEILARTEDAEGSVALSKDTDKIYIRTASAWQESTLGQVEAVFSGATVDEVLVDGAITTESGDFMTTEDDNYLAF